MRIASARGPPLWDACDAQAGKDSQIAPDWDWVTQPEADPKFNDVYRYNMATGELKLLATNPGHMGSWLVNDDGEVMGRARLEGQEWVFETPGPNPEHAWTGNFRISYFDTVTPMAPEPHPATGGPCPTGGATNWRWSRSTCAMVSSASNTLIPGWTWPVSCGVASQTVTWRWYPIPTPSTGRPLTPPSHKPCKSSRAQAEHDGRRISKVEVRPVLVN